MRIVITGSPGTGKTLVAKALSERLGLELIDIKMIVKREKLDKGPEHEVDIKSLSKALSFLKGKDGFVVEGHLACELPLPADFVFVLRTHPDVLRQRLSKRRYPKAKLEGNLMAEMLDYCTQRAEQEYVLAPLELDTSQLTAQEAALRIAAAIKQKKKKLDTVNYSRELEKHLAQSRS